MLLFSGTDVKTCLDVVSLFYVIPIVVGELFIFIQRTSMHRYCNAEVTFSHLFMIEFYLASFIYSSIDLHQSIKIIKIL